MKHKQKRLAAFFLVATGVAVPLAVLTGDTRPRADRVPTVDRHIHQKAVKLLKVIRRKFPEYDDLSQKAWRGLYGQHRQAVRELEARWPQLATGEDWPDL
jgi:hypothetical protein